MPVRRLAFNLYTRQWERLCGERKKSLTKLSNIPFTLGAKQLTQIANATLFG